MLTQYKSLRAMAEELRKRRELDEEKYFRLRHRAVLRPELFILITLFLLAEFIYSGRYKNFSSNIEIVAILFIFIALTGLVLKASKKHLASVNLYNFGILTQGIITDVKFDKKEIGAAAYIIHYNYTCDDKRLSNVQRVRNPNNIPKPQQGDAITVAYDPEEVTTSLIVLDSDYLIKVVKKVEVNQKNEFRRRFPNTKK